ncbi:MAG: magnesium and cobalt transport protein CorA [Syntrophobacterales bacterium RBG_19FT_COMBO_59_10]|nr:MAG: magnesium and cobalt transport protein CorA [Syntrophobacterales bacterium RBG_19FT_COMBO_59_10]
MPKIKKRRSAKAGLPPGALIHIGERHAEKAKIVLCEYDESHLSEKEIHTLEGALPPPDREAVTWVHIDGLQDVHLLEEMGNVFGLHPLILEDILNTEQRPKGEDHGDYFYVVLKLFHESPGGDFVPEQVSIVLGPNWLISIQEKEGKLLDTVRERLRNGRGRFRRNRADYLAHAILDGIVDRYFVILDGMGERIEDLEEALVSRPSPETLRAIQTLKREMLLLRKSVWPLREMIGGLARSDSPLIRESSVIYFRDVYDHAVQVIDTIENYRDMLSGMLDIYLSTISNRMNEIMKVLTIIATVFMPLTFLAGVYGMNFKYMPELEWPWGYFALWGVMILISIWMLIYFRRKKWL